MPFYIRLIGRLLGSSHLCPLYQTNRKVVVLWEQPFGVGLDVNKLHLTWPGVSGLSQW